MPVGRLFVEIGKDVDRMNESLRRAVTTADQAGIKMTRAGQSIVASFQDALNPTKKLEEQINLLVKAGQKEADIISVMGRQLQEATKKAQAHGQPISDVIRKYTDLAAKTHDTGFGVESLGRKISEFARSPVMAMQTSLTGILERLGPLAIGLGGIATAVGAAGIALVKLGISAANDAEALRNLSAQTGLSTQTLQALKQIASEAGLENLDLARTIGRLNEELGRPEIGEFEKSLQRFRISTRDLATGGPRDAIDLLSELGEKLKGIPGSAMRAQAANAALGGRLQELIPLLLNLKGSLHDNIEEMKKTGPVWDDITQNKLLAFDDAIDAVGRTWKTLVTDIKAGVGSILGSFSEFTRAADAGLEKLDLETQVKMHLATQKGVVVEFGQEFNKLKVNAESFYMKAEEGAKKAAKPAAEHVNIVKDLSQAFTEALPNLEAYRQSLARESAVFEVFGKETDKLRNSTERLEEQLERLAPIEITKPAAVETTKELLRTTEELGWKFPRATEKAQEAAETMADVWKRQVSTIATDFSRSIADILLTAGSFGNKITNIFREIGKSIIRALIETLFNPLKQLLQQVMQSMFAMFSGAATAAAAGTGGTAAVNQQTDWVKMLQGGMAIGGGALFVKGLQSTSGWGSWAETVGGGALAGFAIAGPIGAVIGAWAGAVAKGIKAAMGKSTWEAGAMEAARDLGVQIGRDTFKEFITGLGLSESQAYGIRKDLLTSPLFLTQYAYPAALAQGKVNEFLTSLSQVNTVMGTIDLSAPFREFIETGSVDALNKAYTDLFSQSQALIQIMPDFATRLAAVGTAGDAAAEAIDALTEETNAYAESLEELKQAILATIPAEKDMFEIFWETGEILPKLRDMVFRYGGDIEAFRQYAGLGDLRQNLSQIQDLMQNLNQILPDLSPIQQILAGEWGQGTWSGLEAMGLDPAQLTKITDLIKFETGWQEAISQFQQTGKLLRGGVLEQALWQFGGTPGTTALERYAAGFNTVTPALLESVKTAMDAAYQAERATAMDYLKSVSEGIESEIQSATNAVVAELQKILDAINNLGQQAIIVNPSADGRSVPGAASVTININGDVYGYEDFEDKVVNAWTDGYNRQAFAYLNS